MKRGPKLPDPAKTAEVLEFPVLPAERQSADPEDFSDLGALANDFRFEDFPDDFPDGPDFPDEAVSDFFSEAVARILALRSPEAFLEWIRREAPAQFPEIVSALGPAEQRGFLTLCGRQIWDQTPLPWEDFRTCPLPPPQHNRPCLCGSGKKFKRCCQRVAPPMPMPPVLAWSLLLPQLGPEDLRRACRSGRVPPEAVEDLAQQHRRAGKPRKALRLLEPLFAEPGRLGLEAESALMLLLELYEELGFGNKLNKTLERLRRELRPPLRGALWMHRATLAAECDDREEAWRLFEKAGADAPRHPSLSILEVTLLSMEGRLDEALDRARFWVRRLRRWGYEEDEGPVLFLESFRDDPGLVFDALGLVAPADAERLLSWLEAGRERPVPRYRPNLTEGEARLVAPKTVRACEEAWDEVWPGRRTLGVAGLMEPEPEDPWETGVAAGWLAFLEGQPRALDSFQILGDLLRALEEVRSFEDAVKSARFFLLDRAEAVVRKALGKHPGVRLPWDELENRPLLDLLAQRFGLLLDRGRDEEAVGLGGWLLELSPNDNQGIREVLMDLLLCRGDDIAALELCSRYPEDVMTSIECGRVLSLYRLGRRGAALTALRGAWELHGLVFDYLTRKSVRKPELSPYGVTLGGADEAWLYRREMREVWKSVPGLLDWLTEALKELPKPAPWR